MNELGLTVEWNDTAGEAVAGPCSLYLKPMGIRLVWRLRAAVKNNTVWSSPHHKCLTNPANPPTEGSHFHSILTVGSHFRGSFAFIELLPLVNSSPLCLTYVQDGEHYHPELLRADTLRKSPVLHIVFYPCRSVHSQARSETDHEPVHCTFHWLIYLFSWGAILRTSATLHHQEPSDQ